MLFETGNSLRMFEKQESTGIRSAMNQYKSLDFQRIVFTGINMGYLEVYEDELITGFLEALKQAEHGLWRSRSLFDSIRFDFIDSRKEPVKFEFAPQRSADCYGDAFFLMLKRLETHEAEHLRRFIHDHRDRVHSIRVENESVVLSSEDAAQVLSCLSEADERFCAYTKTSSSCSMVLDLNMVDGDIVEIQLIFPHPRRENYQSILPVAVWRAVPNLHAAFKKYAM